VKSETLIILLSSLYLLRSGGARIEGRGWLVETDERLAALIRLRRP
jgi:hypothetical protein